MSDDALEIANFRAMLTIFIKKHGADWVDSMVALAKHEAMEQLREEMADFAADNG